MDEAEGRQPHLQLDVGFLNTEEVSLLNKVIENDEHMEKVERKALSKLRKRIEKERHRQARRRRRRKCSVCNRRSLCSKPITCHVCHFKVCKNCIRHLRNPKEQILCRVCYDVGLLHAQTHSLEQRASYGSQLLKESLKNTFKGTVVPNIAIEMNENITTASPDHSVSSNQSSSYLSTQNLIQIVQKSNTRTNSLTPAISAEKIVYETHPSSCETINDLMQQDESDKEGNNDLEHPAPTGLETMSISSAEQLYMYEGLVLPHDSDDEDVGGEVSVVVSLSGSILKVHVNEVKDLNKLPTEDDPNPYLKCYLLPYESEKFKRQTSIRRKTTCPIFNESFTYDLGNCPDKDFTNIWLTVWSYNPMSADVILGEVMIPLLPNMPPDIAASTDKENQWYQLEAPSRSLLDLQAEVGGMIQIGLMYKADEGMLESSAGDLHVYMKRARFASTFSRDTMVTCRTLSDKSSHMYKSRIVTQQLNPIWNEVQVIASFNALSETEFIEISVWDTSNTLSYSFLGGVVLGPTSTPPNRNCCLENEISHWQAMLKYQNNWMESWHTLRMVYGDAKDVKKVLLPDSISQMIDSIKAISLSEHPTGSITSSETESSLDNPFLIQATANSSREAFPTHAEALVAIEFSEPILLIHVNKVQGLISKSKDTQIDPYVKTYLLPERSKKWKRKTSVKHKTGNPEYNETLKYSIPPNTALSDYSIWLTVWSKEAWKKNVLLGEVHISLKDLDLELDTHKQWYTLNDQVDSSSQLEKSKQSLHQDSSASSEVEVADDDPQTVKVKSEDAQRLSKSYGTPMTEVIIHKGDYDISGEIHFTLKEENKVLEVHIIEASNLAAAAGKDRLSNPYVKLYLIPDKSKRSKEKTSIKRKTLNPTYNETFRYNLSSRNIAECSLWLSVWHNDNLKRNKFLGEVYIPLQEVDLSETQDLHHVLKDR